MQIEVYESRTHKYVREQQERAERLQVESLEAELDDSERRNLRLMKELLDETTLRVRAENTKEDILERMKTLQDEVAEVDRRLNGKAVHPQRISKNRPNSRKSAAVPDSPGPSESNGELQTREEPTVVTDARGNRVQAGTKPLPGSSRKRGGAK